MNDNDLKRLSRLTAILTMLQSKKIITSHALAEKFGVSVRTIYRDMKALEEAGVPIIAEDRKGYTLMEGYCIPPVMFSESEANALITVEQLVQKNSDRSLVKEYTEAINKIKAVLLHSTKNKTELLSNRIAVSPAIPTVNKSDSLALIQNSLTNYKVLRITYQPAHQDEQTTRDIEPFAFYYNQQENWLVIAFCRLRKEYRMFRLDRILKINALDHYFTPHQLTLKDFLDTKQKNFKIPDIPLS